MSHDFWVIIQGQRGEEWERVAGTRRFPVKSPIPVLGNLPGYNMPQRVFLLALDVIEQPTLDRIVKHLSQKFGMSESETAEEMRTAGIPILENDCNVIVHNPQKWF